MADVFYYNLSIGNANIFNSGYPYDQLGILAASNIHGTQSICENPEDYYCSIVRLQFPGFAIPAIQFLVQTPVIDRNKGIYSFTMKYGNTVSVQSWFYFIRQVKAPFIRLPAEGPTVMTQDFESTYYALYDYFVLVQIMNNALDAAFASLQALVPAIAAAKKPFWGFEPHTGLFALYTDPLFFDQGLANHVDIYFNSPAYLMIDGMAYSSENYNDPQGLDNLLIISPFNGLNISQVSGVDYIKMEQQYVSAAYQASLKSILVKTTMNIRSEIFNLDLGSDSASTARQQNTSYTNIMTDFLPDISQPTVGVSSYKFIYNAPSLYRIFEFKQKDPLYEINASVYWTDVYGNTYPLYIEKGQVINIKFMFIKKSVYRASLNLHH